MTSFLISHAIYAVFLFGVLEAACVPISSELTFLLGGAVASGAIPGTHQHPSLALVILLGTAGELIGSTIAYGVGRAGGHPLVRRWGRYVLVTEADVARAERFLVGRGAWALPVARMMPFVRTFAAVVAGLVDVPPVRFIALNAVGTLAYVIALASAGYSLGGQYVKVEHSLSTISYVVVAVIVVVGVAFVVHRVREFRKEAAAGDAPAEPGPRVGGQHRSR